MTIGRFNPVGAALPAVLTVAALAATPALASRATAPAKPREDAAAVATAFCNAVVAGDQYTAVALFADPLRAKADAALRIDAANPPPTGEKPLLGDGLPLTAEPDTIHSCEAEVLSANSVRVVHTFSADSDDAASVRWSDRLALTRGGDRTLRIADVHYANGERLSGWLDAFVSKHRGAAQEGN